MDSLAIKKPVSKPIEARRKPIGQGAHALAQALNRLVEEGGLPRSKYTDFLGQLTVYLNQAFQAVSVLRSSARAMMNEATKDNNLPWDWFLLHQDEDVRCGVISVNPYRSVPVHNHACSSGILLVLEGHLVEKCYQLDASSEPATGLVKLVPGETRHLDAGQWGVHLPDSNDLHSLAAIGGPALALSIQFSPESEKARSWFLTTGDETDSAGYAMRTHDTMMKHAPSDAKKTG
jgi:hypothetical protein